MQSRHSSGGAEKAAGVKAAAGAAEERPEVVRAKMAVRQMSAVTDVTPAPGRKCSWRGGQAQAEPWDPRYCGVSETAD